MTIAELAEGGSVIVAMVGVATFIKALLEYKRQTTAKRFEIFQGLNKRFDEDKFEQLRAMLDIDSPKLAATDYTQKHNFLGFFEEIAISVNSGIMNEEIAFYLFGYYAIRCFQSKNFWSGAQMINKDSIYWSLFRSFAERMNKMESELGCGSIDTRKLKF